VLLPAALFLATTCTSPAMQSHFSPKHMVELTFTSTSIQDSFNPVSSIVDFEVANLSLDRQNFQAYRPLHAIWMHLLG
jgi:hypothetical protein